MNNIDTRTITLIYFHSEASCPICGYLPFRACATEHLPLLHPTAPTSLSTHETKDWRSSHGRNVLLLRTECSSPTEGVEKLYDLVCSHPKPKEDDKEWTLPTEMAA
jgi:hypothetical protein